MPSETPSLMSATRWLRAQEEPTYSTATLPKLVASRRVGQGRDRLVVAVGEAFDGAKGGVDDLVTPSLALVRHH